MNKIVCLCGSTRFREEFERVNEMFTMQGFIVLAPGVFGHSKPGGQNANVTEKQKKMLDELHLRKIDMADGVYVVNPGGYIGDSTRREIEYAKSLGKPISYLVPLERG